MYLYVSQGVAGRKNKIAIASAGRQEIGIKKFGEFKNAS
jgi:hypothetical protein